MLNHAVLRQAEYLITMPESPTIAACVGRLNRLSAIQAILVMVLP